MYLSFVLILLSRRFTRCWWFLLRCDRFWLWLFCVHGWRLLWNVCFYCHVHSHCLKSFCGFVCFHCFSRHRRFLLFYYFVWTGGLDTNWLNHLSWLLTQDLCALKGICSAGKAINSKITITSSYCWIATCLLHGHFLHHVYTGPSQ